jgi:hypothetical protein
MDPADAPEGLVYVGIVLATIGAVTSGFGMNMMKASSRLERHKPLCRRYRLCVGISLACWVNTALDCIAFALTPLVIVAPIGGITIVASVLFARLGWAGEYEYVVWEQWVAISAVVGGVAIVDVFGPHPDPVLNTTSVLDHFHDPSFICYELFTVAVLMVVYSGIFVGKLGGPNLETTVASAIAAGMCSGITMTMMKVMATCVGAWLLHGSLPFWFPEFWVALGTLIVVAFVLLHMLNICIQSANLALSTPVYQVSVILFTIIAGCAFYREADVATRSELLMFLMGVMLVLAGLGVLIFKREMPEEKLIPSKDRGDRENKDTAIAIQQVSAEICAVEAPSSAELYVDPDPDL